MYVTACLAQLCVFYVCTFGCLPVCVCVFIGGDVSAGTDSVCVFVYTAVFQLSEWIRLSGQANTAVTVALTHTHTEHGMAVGIVL